MRQDSPELAIRTKKGIFSKNDASYSSLKLPDVVDYNFHVKPILSDNCYTCDNSSYYLNNTCYVTCPSYYMNTTSPSRQCASCTSNCLSCPVSTTVCTSCASPYFIFIYNSSAALCITECPAGYYLIGQTCHLCSSPCSNCSAELTCLTPTIAHHLETGYISK